MTFAEPLTAKLGRDTLRISMGDVGVSERVKELREKRGLTQAALAERIGVSAIFIRKLEAGERQASIKTLNDLARVLGVTLRVDFVERKGGRHGR